MISLEQFVKSIQSAILEANESISSRNENFIREYFEEEDDSGLETKIDDFLQVATQVSKDPKKIEDAIEKLSSLTKWLKSRSKEGSPIGQKTYTAKTIQLSYPIIDEEGNMSNKLVEVPLLTMVPLVNPVIDEVRLSTDLEIWLDNERVNIDFGKFDQQIQPEEGGRKSTIGRTIGHLDIILKRNETSAGLSQIVESYEKVLKSQLPN